MKRIFIVSWYFLGCLCSLPALVFLWVSGLIGYSFEKPQ